MMAELWKVAPHTRRQLATALETGILALPLTESSLLQVPGLRSHAAEIAKVLNRLHRLGLSARACGAWLRTLETALSSEPRYDLVWSGPWVPGVHARNTAKVYKELFESARRSLWVSTFVYFDGREIFGPLARQLDAHPHLKVILLLNIQREYGDTSRSEDVVYRFARKFWTEDWPGANRPKVYYDPRSVAEEGSGGVLHAKGAVADEEVVFITSANLTEAALHRNIELGLVVRDPALAFSVVSHFRSLIDNKILRRLPVI